MEKKFELISSMMKRLGVSPRLFVLQCLKDNMLSFNCIVKDEKSTIEPTVSVLTENSVAETGNIVETKETEAEQPSVIPSENEKVSDVGFYAPITNDDWDEFELKASTQDKLRCGMFVYSNGSRFIIRKSPLSINFMQKHSLMFKGILFADKDNCFLAVRFGEEQCGYNRALKKMPLGYRIPYASDCKILSTYLNVICDSFKTLHINLSRINRIFCLDYCGKNIPATFDLHQGTLETDSVLKSAGFLQVLTIKKF